MKVIDNVSIRWADLYHQQEEWGGGQRNIILKIRFNGQKRPFKRTKDMKKGG